MPGVMAFPKPYADVVARLRVPSGFLLVAVFAWFSRPTTDSLMLGVPLAIAGLALRAWAAGYLAKNQRLVTGGPYAYTRNPLYVGTLLVAAGVTVSARSLGLGVLFAAVFIFVYLPVIQNEQQHVRRLFPEFDRYAAEVPVLWPQLRAYRGGSGERFQMGLYLRNQEYQAAAGYLAGMVFLLWKALG
jgi:protein-S-isoprenylcysteine O-methyltransferase Ste14